MVEFSGRWGGGQEQAEAEVAGVAEAERAGDRGGEREAEAGRGPAAAVVAGLAAKTLELDRPQTLAADPLFLGHGNDGRQVGPAQELLLEHVAGEGAGRGV